MIEVLTAKFRFVAHLVLLNKEGHAAAHTPLLFSLKMNFTWTRARIWWEINTIKKFNKAIYDKQTYHVSIYA